jgi:hypothetical protein
LRQHRFNGVLQGAGAVVANGDDGNLHASMFLSLTATAGLPLYIL